MGLSACDLRIGNLVSIKPTALHFDGLSQKGTFFEISELKTNVVHFKGFHAGEFYKDIEPIPFTEDWRMKFGLSKIENPSGRYKYLEGYWNFGSCYLFDMGYGVCDISTITYSHEDETRICTIEYIHQAQNLFKELTQKELKIKEHAFNN